MGTPECACGKTVYPKDTVFCSGSQLDLSRSSCTLTYATEHDYGTVDSFKHLISKIRRGMPLLCSACC